MKLQDRMFGLIADWHASKLSRKDFLADKNISEGKFDYWLRKYKAKSKEETPKIEIENFKQIPFPSEPVEKDLVKILELKTASGIELTVFERC